MIDVLLRHLKFKGSVGASARLKIISLWQAIGRTGEVALASFTTARWNDIIDNIEFVWRDEKNGKEYLMSFFTDFLSYKLSFYHALGCHIVLGGLENGYSTSMNREDEWLFPDLAAVRKHSPPLIKLFDEIRKECPQMIDATRKSIFFPQKLQYTND